MYDMQFKFIISCIKLLYKTNPDMKWHRRCLYMPFRSFLKPPLLVHRAKPLCKLYVSC